MLQNWGSELLPQRQVNDTAILKNSKKAGDQPSPEFETWNLIRLSKSYTDIVDLSNVWLSALWGNADRLGLAPSGSKSFNKCPNIRISKKIPSKVGGIYIADGQYHGPSIRIANAMVMFQYETPLFTSLRDTILHEVQHAIDDRYGVWSADHNHWFEKRLNKLINIFPIDSL